MITKECSKCNIELPLDEFGKHPQCRLGVNSKCKKCIREHSRGYYKENAEKVCKRTKKYREDRPDWYRRVKREARRKDPLTANIRRGIWGCLAGRQKGSQSIEHLGCTTEELWTYLKSLFQEGMTRENYGEWHVDHIRPLASFDFEVDTENALREAWHYTNLQPLWAKDNLSKGSSWKNKGS